MELVRETPAGPGRKDVVDWRAVADKLRAEPGEWFVVREGERDQPVRMTASRIALGQTAGFRGEGFEAVARRANGVTKAYARFVGTGGA